MLRNDTTISRLVNSKGCRTLQSLIKLMNLVKEEELIANSLKIVRYAIKEESNH